MTLILPEAEAGLLFERLHEVNDAGIRGVSLDEKMKVVRHNAEGMNIHRPASCDLRQDVDALPREAGIAKVGDPAEGVQR